MIIYNKTHLGVGQKWDKQDKKKCLLYYKCPTLWDMYNHTESCSILFNRAFKLKKYNKRGRVSHFLRNGTLWDKVGH